MCVVEAIRPAQYSRRIPCVTQRSPRNARAWVTNVITAHGCDPETVALALSELVTNVVLHAAGSARITITVTDKEVAIAVADRHHGGIPQPIAEPDWTEEHQRGLVLLNAFSPRGVRVQEVHGWGKEVVVVLAVEAPKEAGNA